VLYFDGLKNGVRTVIPLEHNLTGVERDVPHPQAGRQLKGRNGALRDSATYNT
jgi:hypothetical protein